MAKCLQKDINNRYANGIELQEALMQGSIGAISKTNPDESWNTEVLLKENERLQGLVLYYQENENKQPAQVISDAPADNKVVRMSKPIFVLFMILLCGFTVFSAVVMDKFGGRIYNGVVSRLFKPSKKATDSAASNKIILPQKKTPYSSLRPVITKMRAIFHLKLIQPPIRYCVTYNGQNNKRKIRSFIAIV
ncbi:hypothetical protein ACRQ5D_15910 [Mucilaginibacter sp. P25]|uniref:hypothetical protein n=1 Tax=unclassified Mucilaginibacter TaxID=2617802 RepID=UPI003D6790DA